MGPEGSKWRRVFPGSLIYSSEFFEKFGNAVERISKILVTPANFFEKFQQPRPAFSGRAEKPENPGECFKRITGEKGYLHCRIRGSGRVTELP
ncbi:hypothetical protein Mboo_1088 [Methanoregula boonei 6A8]|jgi:hypothetical protein|uniref:Uncharacterized protein n=1 Tax=Methanoregula boonei (strain DSM 21154 / JCM 14090 / 6A8) TaxID=456442 RepID=A7I795_METB6|nr:hypothetical protein Mboo_1088 [Methanoregula boonei 6A8]